MADAKLTALTEETTPVDADLLYLVDDVAGTPTSKKITWANIKAAIRSALVSDTAYGSGWNSGTTVAPSQHAVYVKIETVATLAGIIASAQTNLTDHTPNNLTTEQWATEEAVVAQASAPTSAVVLAWLSGELRANGSGSPAANDRGGVKLQVSFDGGSNFADCSQENFPAMPSTNTDFANTFSVVGRATGTVTGDIQVRAMVRDINQANDCQFRMGKITMLVHPQ